MGRIRVGLSGWDYDGWRGDFYPADLPARRRLEYIGERFDTAEINGSFYSLQRASSYVRWREATPEGFVFAVKGSRFVTHMKRMRDAEDALAKFFDSGVYELEDKLGPVLWQLPANLPFHVEVVAGFLSALPRRVQHAFEVRHKSYDDPQFYKLLEKHDVACVVSDSPTWPLFERRTAALCYVRLHGHATLYTSGYSSRSLDRWAEKCNRWAEDGPVLVYFDNDARGRAPYDALGLVGRLS